MNLQDIDASASPETQVNENFETLDAMALYGKRQPVTTGLTWGYYGGRWGGTSIAAGTVTLTNAADNHLVAHRSTGAVSVATATTNWNDTATYARIYKLTTAGNVVTVVEDHRMGPYGIFHRHSAYLDAIAAGTLPDLTGSDASLDIIGLAAAQGGGVTVKGGTSSTSANAGGAAAVQGGTPGATGVGGAASVTGAAGGATSGAGGAASVTGGAGTAGNSSGGVASVTGGAGQGTAAGAVSRLVGGASGAGATGNGGAAQVTGGAAASTNGNGGSVVIAGGAKTGSGVAGMIIRRSVELSKQGTPAAKTTSTTLTAAEVLTGIITVNQGAAGSSALQLPLASDMDTAMPDAAADDAFDFSVINISTVAAEDASITTHTGWTLVGNMDVASNAAATDKSSGRFRARKTGAGAWSLYRVA